jgi:serum/glucocorticoid-regulated kinase 2
LKVIQRLYSQEIQFDEFDVIKVIGRGSYAKVYLIRKGAEGSQAQFYALKVLKKKALFDKNLLHHTLQER